MKRRFLIPMLAALVVALFAFACNKTNETTTDTGTTAETDTMSTSTSATDTSATTSTTGTTASSLSDADKDFINKAAIGGMAEVQFGQVAATNAQNADVKTFGNRMVQDHGAANDELKQLAASKGITLPTDLDDKHKSTLQELQSKKGKDFDKAYMSDMVKDHEEDVAEFQKQSTSAQDPDLKNWATKTLPTLQDHLKMAKATNSKLK